MKNMLIPLLGNLGNEALIVSRDDEVYALGSNGAGCLGQGIFFLNTEFRALFTPGPLWHFENPIQNLLFVLHFHVLHRYFIHFIKLAFLLKIIPHSLPIWGLQKNKHLCLLVLFSPLTAIKTLEFR